MEIGIKIFKKILKEERNKMNVQGWLLSQCEEMVEEVPSLGLEEEDGSVVACGIEHIVRPDLFYINLIDKKYKGEQLLQLNKELTTHFIGTSIKPHQPYKCGQFVAVKENIDGIINAFRGQIVDDTEDLTRIRVFLIDFGDTIVVGDDDIIPLPGKFAAFPQFAIACQLKNIKPFRGESRFSVEAIVFFRKLAPREKVFKFKFDKNQNDQPMSIELFMDDACQKTFSEALIKNHFGMSIDSTPEWNPMVSDYQTPVVAMAGNSEGLEGHDEERLCKFYR